MQDDWLVSDYNTIGWDGILSESFETSSTGWVNDPNRGRVLEFEGRYDSNDWVDIDDYALPRFQNRTIVVWIKNNGIQEDTYRTNVFNSDYSPGEIELSIGAAGAGSTRQGKLEGRLGDCKMMRVPESALDVNEWNLGALVIGNLSPDANWVYCQLILNGVMIADNTGFGHGSGSAVDLTIPAHTDESLDSANIGSSGEGDGRFINASLDNFRIYDYNMTVQDVNALYMLERGNSTVTYKEPNLIIWYKFNETSGRYAEDSGRDKDEHIYHANHEESNIVEKDPPGPPYDPDNKDIVNLLDYGALADNWLVEKLWPEP
jgi:hypothetical protein